MSKFAKSFFPLLDSTSYKNGDIKMAQKTIVFFTEYCNAFSDLFKFFQNPKMTSFPSL